GGGARIPGEPRRPPALPRGGGHPRARGAGDAPAARGPRADRPPRRGGGRRGARRRRSGARRHPRRHRAGRADDGRSRGGRPARVAAAGQAGRGDGHPDADTLPRTARVVARTGRRDARAPISAMPGTLDWRAIGDEAVELLRAYLAIDTTNPPGNEIAGARFLADVLTRGGIESRTAESAPGRANLVARVRGDSSLGGIVLHHHIDVVYADRR